MQGRTDLGMNNNKKIVNQILKVSSDLVKMRLLTVYSVNFQTSKHARRKQKVKNHLLEPQSDIYGLENINTILNFKNSSISYKASTFDVKHSSQYVYLTPSSFPVLQRSSMKTFTFTA